MKRLALILLLVLFAAPASADLFGGRLSFGRVPDVFGVYGGPGSGAVWIRTVDDQDRCQELAPHINPSKLSKLRAGHVYAWKIIEGKVHGWNRKDPGPPIVAPNPCVRTTPDPAPRLTADACWPIVAQSLPASRQRASWFSKLAAGAWSAVAPRVNSCLAGCQDGLSAPRLLDDPVAAEELPEPAIDDLAKILERVLLALEARD